MKAKIILTAALVFSVVMASAEEITFKDVAVSVIDAYIPSNIKVGDNALVVVNGLFPNSCYSYSRSDVYHVDDFNHQIKTIAKVRSGICLRVLVPFNNEVSLGQLKAGEHRVSFIADDDTYFNKTFIVK